METGFSAAGVAILFDSGVVEYDYAGLCGGVAQGRDFRVQVSAIFDCRLGDEGW